MPDHETTATIGGFPFHAITFDKDGKPDGDFPTLDAAITEVVIVSHGWNNSPDEAQRFYDELFEQMKTAASDLPAFPKKKLAVIGVFWPSKRFNFADDNGQQGGPAASVGGASPSGATGVDQAIADLRDAFADESQKKRDVVRQIVDLAAQRNTAAVGTELVSKLRLLLDDQDTTLSGTDAAALFVAPTMPQVLYKAAQQQIVLPTGAAGGTASPAAGIGSLFSGIDNAFENLLNVTSYYQMKKRAATVGATGVAPLIDALAASATVQRIHLVGHSFGGRLVSAAAMASKTAAAPEGKLRSMSLLQAAFSHNGFAPAGQLAGDNIPEGYFRSVLTQQRVKGPLLVTHTHADRAVGKAYAIASRISRQSASGLGGPNDPYGGIGSNGAIRVAAGEASTKLTALQAYGSSYAWEHGKLHNLKSDGLIKNHGDVENKHVAWAIASAIAS